MRAARDRRVAESPGSGGQGCRPASGIAIIHAHGDSAPRTTTAFARARELAAASRPDRALSANYGLWVAVVCRGESTRRASQNRPQRQRPRKPQSPEPAVPLPTLRARQVAVGNFALRASHLERTLAMFDPAAGPPIFLPLRPGHGEIAAMVFFALTLGPWVRTRPGSTNWRRRCAPGRWQASTCCNDRYGGICMCTSACRQQRQRPRTRTMRSVRLRANMVWRSAGRLVQLSRTMVAVTS